MKHTLSKLFTASMIAGSLPLSAQLHHAPAEKNPSCIVTSGKIERSRVNTLAAPTATLYSHGDPTAEEQYTLELINRARANPAEEGVRLATTTDPEVLSAYSYFKINTNLLKTQFAAYPSRPPLAFNDKLIKAARKHSDWMKANNVQSHTGANGSSPFDRMDSEGYTDYTAAGENVAAYARNLWYGHAGFNVDWGEQNQIDLGHRENIMNFKTTVFTEIGVGITLASGTQGNVGPMIITQDFGKKTDYFLTGVVYQDFNSNGFYDVGEGVQGVTITPNKGNYYAVTSTSGGYAIPMTNVSGSVSVTASGGGVGTSKTVTISGQNVKLDFTAEGLPEIITLISPEDEQIVEADTVEFLWRDGINITKYWLEISEKSDFSTVLKRDSTIDESGYVFKNLTHGKTYYWRIKASNGKAWGEFSETRSFTVQLPLPAQVELVSPEDKSSNPVPDFTWKKIDNAVKYWIQFSTDSTFKSINYYDSAITKTFQEVSYSNFNTGINYWRVAANNGIGWGEFSKTRSFLIFTMNVSENATKFKLQNSPNPFEKATNITFTLLKDQNARLRIYNAAGKEVFTTLLKDAHEGENTFVWNAEGFENGVYYYAIEADGMKGVRPMILVK